MVADRNSEVPASDVEATVEGADDISPDDETLASYESPVGDDLTQEKTNHSTKSIAESLPLWQEVCFVAVICTAQFTTQSALGQALAILQIIGDSFGITDPSQLSWLIAGYSLTVGTFILFSGRLGDTFGYKKMLIIGYFWFALWSVIAGLAVYSNHVLFVFARVLQGIGPSITLPNGLALLGATYAPGHRKNMVFSFFGATSPGGSIVGAAFAGLFALAWWPWAFWSFGIALTFVGVLAIYVVPNPPPKKVHPQESLWEKIVGLDIPGAVVGITALVLLNFAWNQAPIVGWQEPYVYVLLIISILLFPVFFYIELKIAPDPLIPFHALSMDVSFVLGCIVCGWSAFGIWVYYTWQFLEMIRGDSPLLASAHFAPVIVVGALASLSTGWLLSHVRPAWVMTIALTCFLTGTILIATAPVRQSYWAQTFVCFLIMPFGMDMSFPAATVILSNAVERHHQGIAASLVNTVVNYSISLALGIAGTLEVHINHGGHNKADVLYGYRGAWYLAIGFAGAGVFISITYVLKTYHDQRKKKV